MSFDRHLEESYADHDRPTNYAEERQKLAEYWSYRKHNNTLLSAQIKPQHAGKYRGTVRKQTQDDRQGVLRLGYASKPGLIVPKDGVPIVTRKGLRVP